MSARAGIKALLACDLDGTLLAADGSPAFGIVEALADLDVRGVRLAVCTGRPLNGAAKAASVLHADPVAYVCYHGALIVDAATGEWLRHLTIPDVVATGIVEEAFQLGLSATFYEGDERRELVAPVFGAPTGLPAPRGITRLVFSGDSASIAAAAPRLVASWSSVIRLERAGGGTLAVLSAAADKGEGLKLVAARLAIPLAHVVACGDSAVDESLLRTAGVSVAVGDPPDAALAGADEHVDQEGLARLLRRRLEPFTLLP